LSKKKLKRIDYIEILTLTNTFLITFLISEVYENAVLSFLSWIIGISVIIVILLIAVEGLVNERSRDFGDDRKKNNG